MFITVHSRGKLGAFDRKRETEGWSLCPKPDENTCTNTHTYARAHVHIHQLSIRGSVSSLLGFQIKCMFHEVLTFIYSILAWRLSREGVVKNISFYLMVLFFKGKR